MTTAFKDRHPGMVLSNCFLMLLLPLQIMLLFAVLMESMKLLLDFTGARPDVAGKCLVFCPKWHCSKCICKAVHSVAPLQAIRRFWSPQMLANVGGQGLPRSLLSSLLVLLGWPRTCLLWKWSWISWKHLARSSPWGKRHLRETCFPNSWLDASYQRCTALLLGFSFHKSSDLVFRN